MSQQDPKVSAGTMDDDDKRCGLNERESHGRDGGSRKWRVCCKFLHAQLLIMEGGGGGGTSMAHHLQVRVAGQVQTPQRPQKS